MNKIAIPIGLVGSCLIVGIFLLNSVNAKETQDYQVQAILRCQNQSFQSDILLVTDVNRALEFQCTVDITPSIPEGYLPSPSSYQWTVTSGKIQTNGKESLWSDPDPGLQTIRVSSVVKYLAPQPAGLFSRKQPDIEIPIEANLKCLIPLKVEKIEGGKVNGFSVGEYPDPTDPEDLKTASNPGMVKAHADVYQPPTLFYPVTKETYRLRIYKEYTLGDFDLDPRFLPLTYPRYVVIDPRILRKIDLLEAVVRNAGISLSKFKIFYGYRSPYYNLGSRESDGEKTLKSGYSLHMYGLAVDILIDEDDDLVMDDLNHDGIITEGDAQELMQYVNQLDKTLLAENSDLVGGAGWYPHHDFYQRGAFVQSPYVHMDARGYTHGNQLIRWIGEDTIGIRKQKKPYTLKKPIPAWPW